jgi:hypothetical protein
VTATVDLPGRLCPEPHCATPLDDAGRCPIHAIGAARDQAATFLAGQPNPTIQSEVNIRDQDARVGVPLGLAFPWGVAGVDPNGTLVGRSLDAGPLATHLEPYDNVSRRHARLWRAGERLFVRDTDSLNGTFVNNERLDPGATRELHLGDIVRFGADLQATVVRCAPHERRGP